MRGSSFLLGILIALVVVSIFMVFEPYFGGGDLITGFASSGSTLSNVTVSKSFSITLSTNLSNGILFGNLSTVTNANATSNYDGASSGTTYFINVSNDATINVDFCTSANSPMTSSGGDTIGLGNETYSNATTTSSTVPAIGSQVALTTTDVKSGSDFAPGTANYYRFWLTVNSNVPSGDYNNSLTFTGKERGAAC